MEKVLTDFVKALRNTNVRLSPAETLDAMSVIDEVGYDDRELLKRSLSIVLPKTPDEKQKFETCFDDSTDGDDTACTASKDRVSNKISVAE